MEQGKGFISRFSNIINQSLVAKKYFNSVVFDEDTKLNERLTRESLDFVYKDVGFLASEVLLSILKDYLSDMWENMISLKDNPYLFVHLENDLKKMIAIVLFLMRTFNLRRNIKDMEINEIPIFICDIMTHLHNMDIYRKRLQRALRRFKAGDTRS